MRKDEKWQKEFRDIKGEYLIWYDPGKFVIVIDNDGDIDWETSKAFDEKPTPDSSKHLDILNKSAMLETGMRDDLIKKDKTKIKRQIGEAMARNFYAEYDLADNLLENAADTIKVKNSERSRLYILSSAGFFTLFVLEISIVSILFKKCIICTFSEQFFYLLVATLAGSLGAFFSIVLRLGKVFISSLAEAKLHYIEGMSKIFGGMISALIISLAFQSGLLLSVFNTGNCRNCTMILLAIIAGASERLAPSIIQKVEGETKK